MVEWPPGKRIVFTEEMKEKVRRPIGRLVSGRDPDEATAKVKNLIEELNPPLVIAVGDYVSEMLQRHGVPVQVFVVDGRVERRWEGAPELKVKTVERAENEAGGISPEAASKLHRLILSPESWPALLLIDGEEDLLALAAILSAPPGAVVVYGQPGRGAVVVEVDEGVKGRMREAAGLA